MEKGVGGTRSMQGCCRTCVQRDSTHSAAPLTRRILLVRLPPRRLQMVLMDLRSLSNSRVANFFVLQQPEQRQHMKPPSLSLSHAIASSRGYV